MRKLHLGILCGLITWLAACTSRHDTAHAASRDSLPIADTAAQALADTSAVSAPLVDSPINTAQASEAAPRQMTGKFQQLVEGDYLHFELRDDADGKKKSFFLAADIPQKDWMPFYEHPEYKGKKVKITWRNTDRYLEHAGAVNNIDEVLSIELLK